MGFAKVFSNVIPTMPKFLPRLLPCLGFLMLLLQVGLLIVFSKVF